MSKGRTAAEPRSMRVARTRWFSQTALKPATGALLSLCPPRTYRTRALNFVGCQSCRSAVPEENEKKSNISSVKPGARELQALVWQANRLAASSQRHSSQSFHVWMDFQAVFCVGMQKRSFSKGRKAQKRRYI